MSEWQYIGTLASGSKITREGQRAVGIVWSGLDSESECMMSICMGMVRCGAYFSTWHRDGHVVRLALSEGSAGELCLGII